MKHFNKTKIVKEVIPSKLELEAISLAKSTGVCNNIEENEIKAILNS